jgi:hypothetical protein
VLERALLAFGAAALQEEVAHHCFKIVLFVLLILVGFLCALLLDLCVLEFLLELKLKCVFN